MPILLIGCPCALVISTPAAIAAALSAGARRGLLMKGGAVLETLGKVTMVAFDKTGTLTEGKPEVTDIVAFGRSEARGAVAARRRSKPGSSHPLALAILDRRQGRRRSRAAGLRLRRRCRGKGVTGKVGGETLFLGSPQAAGERADAQR